MSDFQIISDSSCDLPEIIRKDFHIDLVPYSVTFDSKKYDKEIIEIKPKEFYEKIINEKLFPKTSLPSIQEYADVFEKYLSKGIDVLCMCLTAKFSGSYQSALNAKQILSETYPERQIQIFDTIQATGGQGLVVYEAARMKKAGYCMNELIEKLHLLKQTACINFTVDSLEYLQKGGRIGKASALAGTILNIKPIIRVQNGELIPFSKVRGRKKALRAIIDITINEILEKKEEYQICLINAYRMEDIMDIKKILIEEYQISILEPIWDVGVTIGTHAGSTAVGICYIKKFETL